MLCLLIIYHIFFFFFFFVVSVVIQRSNQQSLLIDQLCIMSWLCVHLRPKCIKILCWLVESTAPSCQEELMRGSDDYNLPIYLAAVCFIIALKGLYIKGCVFSFVCFGGLVFILHFLKICGCCEKPQILSMNLSAFEL